MTKTYETLTLRTYTIEQPAKPKNSKTELPVVSVHDVDDHFRNLIDLMTTNQETYYKDSFLDMCDTVLKEGIKISGSTNSNGRVIGIEPVTVPDNNPYNFSEMFRSLIVSRIMVRIQEKAIVELIDPTKSFLVKDVLKEFSRVYPHVKKPKEQWVKNLIHRVNNGHYQDSVPSPDKKLPLWATDTHYCKLTRDNNTARLSIPVEGYGRVILVFDLPVSKRFKGGVLTRPTVFIDKNNRVCFTFTVKKDAPELSPDKGNYVGVDLGIVNTSVSTVWTGDGFTSPYHDPPVVRYLSEKIDDLTALISRLYVKEELCRVHGRVVKAGVLRVELDRVKAKRTRLKRERSIAQARHITDLAVGYGACVLVEDLSWTPNSKWDYSQQQSRIVSAAVKKGVRVRKVNAKDTSQVCSGCGSRLKHNGRRVTCLSCDKSLDRDVNASRNVIVKKVRKSFDHVSQLSVQTRVSNPVVPGVYLGSVVGPVVMQGLQHY